MTRVLVLMPDGKVSAEMLSSIETKILRKNPAWFSRMMKLSMCKTLGVSSLLEIKSNTKAKSIVKPELAERAMEQLADWVKRYEIDAIICYDVGMCKLLSGDESATLWKYQLSLFPFQNINAIIGPDLTSWQKDPKILFWNDIALDRVFRFADGKVAEEPAFNYKVVHNIKEFDEAFEALSGMPVFASDIETMQRNISVIGFGGLLPDGKFMAYVISFINPQSVNKLFWKTNDELYVRHKLRHLMRNDSYKIFFNHSYDTKYLMHENMVPKNTFLDPYHMWWALYCEMPKTLARVASATIAHYTFWKEEGKGDSTGQTIHESIINKPAHIFKAYLRYNALDVYYTFLCAFRLAKVLMAPGNERFLHNYHMVMMLQQGPCAEMSIRGLLADPERQNKIKEDNLAIEKHELKRLQLMTAFPDFNPNSSAQVGEFLYNILGEPKPTLVGKTAQNKKTSSASTDKKSIKKLNGPFAKIFTSSLLAFKEAEKKRKDFGEMATWHGAFYTNINASGTETGRFSSRAHALHVGGNGQNITKSMRAFLKASKDHVLVEIDFSQSDAVFVALACEDPNYIKVMLSGIDAHSRHASFIFQIPEEEILKGKAEDADWVEDPVTGVRQIQKKVSHGTSYLMSPPTMIENMGIASVIASALKLGFQAALRWTDQEAQHFVKTVLQAKFYQIYPKLKTWHENLAGELLKCKKIATTYFGFSRRFFGVPTDKSVQRKYAAFLGQGGTAANTNRALLQLYYSEEGKRLRAKTGFRIKLQVHDSIVFEIPIEWAFYAVKKIREIMEREDEWKGIKFKVRTDAKWGVSWGKGLTTTSKDGNMLSLVKAENEIRAYFGQEQNFKLDDRFLNPQTVEE